MAVAGLGVAQEMGFSVPERLSVASFDDSILCEAVRPSLTACERDIEGYGARAARALVALTEGQPVAPEEPEAAKLVPRASTAAPPPGG